MKKTGGILLALALITTLLWLVLELRSAEPAVQQGPRLEIERESGGLPAGALPERELAGALAEDADDRVALAAEEAQPVAEPIEDGPRCRILGRVVDTAGAPLAEIRISVYSVGGSWSERGGEDAYEVRTAGDGRFEVEAPLPTNDWISLTIRPSRFHALTGRDFGLAGGRNQDPLVEGDNDLGTFTLATTGAIAGRVTGVGGIIPGGGHVRLDGSFPGGYSLNGMVDETGRYLIEHVPAGTYDIEALAPGYLNGHLASIEVRELATSEGNDLVLEPAPSVSGRVVDEAGRPLAEVRVHGWPVGSGQGASDRSDEQGLFTVYLPQDEPYAFTAKKKGYVTFGESPPRSAVYEPGTTGIEIVLKRAVQTTFLVVDAKTGLPVERFGIRVGKKPNDNWGSSIEREEVPAHDFPGGELTVPADPEKHAYSIQAPGYGPQRESVEHESPTEARQTIRLEAEARIRGRVLFERQPLARATVRIEKGYFRKDGAPAVDPAADRDVWDDDWTTDLDEFTGRLRILSTAEDGTFELGELAAGTYAVALSASGLSPRALEEQRVKAGEVLDLGDLELVAGAVVRGRVVVGVGAAAPGLEVFLDDTWDNNKSTVDAGGNFEFRGLAAGTHTLEVEDTQGIVIGMEPFQFEIAAAEEKEVLLDLSPFQPCTVRVRVLDGEAPVTDGVVGMGRGDRNGWSQLGRLEGNEELTVEIEAGEGIRFHAISSRGLYLGRTETPLELSPGEEASVAIQLSLGRLTVIFPEEFEMPERGRASVWLRSATTPDRRGAQLVDLYYRSPGSMPNEVRWSGSANDLGVVSPGRYRIEVKVRTLEEREHGNSWEDTGDAFQGEVEVKAGERATCRLTRS